MSVKWITGNSGAGKTTLARKMLAATTKPTVMLDGDTMRWVWPGLGLDEASRRTQNLRIARLVTVLRAQGLDVIVATICPYRDLRAEVKKLTECEFIYLPDGHVGPDYPYEVD